jgi:hypothetical protein
LIPPDAYFFFPLAPMVPTHAYELVDFFFVALQRQLNLTLDRLSRRGRAKCKGT